MLKSISCALAVMAMLASSAMAQSIGVHFPSNRDNAMLAADEVAGVVSQGNWNSSDGGADAAANANGSIAGAKDSNGDATTANVEWTSNGTWNTTNGMDTADAKLMNGYIDAVGADGFATISVSDIPYSQYDAIVYFGSDGNGRTGQITDGTTTYGYSTFSNDPNGGGGFDAGSDYIQTMETGDGRPESNYAVFSDLSDSSFSVEVIRGSNNSGFHGIQIVNTVPEPSSMVLAALGLLSLVRLRRRR